MTLQQPNQSDKALAVNYVQHYLRNIFSLINLISLTSFLCWAAALDEAHFLEVDSLLERQGSTLAFVECVLTISAYVALFWSIRREKRKKVWLAGFVFTLVALWANLADYYGTLQASPDLALEISPIWNSVLRDTGFEFAKFFGLWGKLSLSFLAGACLIFYVQNVHRLQPHRQLPITRLLFHLGERCDETGERWLPFMIILAFYFACANLFCFYIAYANSLVNDLPALSQLPPLPSAVFIALLIITAFFLIITNSLLRRLPQ